MLIIEYKKHALASKMEQLHKNIMLIAAMLITVNIKEHKKIIGS